MLFDPNRWPREEKAGLRAGGPLSPFVVAVLLLIVLGVLTAILFAIFG